MRTPADRFLIMRIRHGVLLSFIDTESNGLMRAPFPAGDNSSQNFIDIVVRAYDEHGAYAEKWTSVKVLVYVFI